jgi:hypothetical protein
MHKNQLAIGVIMEIKRRRVEPREQYVQTKCATIFLAIRLSLGQQKTLVRALIRNTQNQ